MSQLFMDYAGFAGFPTRFIEEHVWLAGGPNSVVSATTAFVRISTSYLTKGDEYEIEGVIAPTHELAADSATIKDTLLAAQQLTAPANAELLCERQPHLRSLRAQDVPLLIGVGELPERRLGLRVDYNTPPI